jgi:hypothetical protein
VEREEVTQQPQDSDGDTGSGDFGAETFRVSSVSVLRVATQVRVHIYQDDFQNALEGDFSFEGSFAYGSPLPQAPNPCLAIENFGFLGFPFNEREAKLIIERSAQSPYGHGERTLVDKEVRDTWEIEPTQISFHNPAWDGFLIDLVETLCKKLGVNSSTSPPRLELYKLLLYESGSQ